MKKTQITLALNALALAGMLVFAAQSADAATPTSLDTQEITQTSQSIDVNETEVADASSIDDATEVASADVESLDTPDVGELDSVSEIETEGPESN